MLVSIITVCYNSEATIADTIRSVKEQTHKLIEHVIIDGGSTDNTLQIVKKCGHVGTIISEKDNGIYDAMNKGITLAKGEVIGLLNSDDFFHENTVVEKIVAAFKVENCDAVYSDLIFIHAKKTNTVKRKWIAGNFDHKKFLKGWMPPHPTVYVRAELYKKYGTFNLRLRCSADYDILIRLFYVQKVKVKYVKGISVRMRAGGQSTRSVLNRLQAHREDYTAWRLNNIKPKWYTLIFKPLRKLKQFIVTNKKYA